MMYADEICQVMNCINSRERTIEGFIDIFSQSGWKLSQVKRDAGNKILWPCIIAVPDEKGIAHANQAVRSR